MFGHNPHGELYAAEIVQPGSTRPAPVAHQPTAGPEDPHALASWISANELRSSLRSEHRQRAEMAQQVLTVEQQLRDAHDEALREANVLLNERARAEAAEARAGQLVHDKKRLQREVSRLKEQLDQLTAKRRAERDRECEECDKALASTVARFRQQQRAWIRERQRMASAAQEMGTHMMNKEQQVERAAKRIDEMQREMETAVLAVQHELAERDDGLTKLRQELEESQAQCTKASALLARSERERLEARSTTQQMSAELKAQAAQLARLQDQNQQAEQQVREMQPVQQRAAVLEAEKAALQRELDLAHSHGRELLSAAREEASKTAKRLDEQIEHGQKQAVELEVSATAIATLKADHAEAIRNVESHCEDKCRTMESELAERVAELATITGAVEAAKQAGQALLSRESAKAEAAMLAMRTELERAHEEALREAVKLERARATAERHKAVAEVEARSREAERSRELEHAAQQARSRAEAAVQDQQRMNQATLASYTAELTALRESLGAKKSSLLPGNHSNPVRMRGGPATLDSQGLSRLAVAAWEGGLRFDPAGAARNANLHGVELRVSRNDAYQSMSNSTAFPATTTSMRVAADDVASVGAGVGSDASRPTPATTVAASLDLARCNEEMAEVQQRRHALEEQIAAFTTLTNVERTGAQNESGDHVATEASKLG